MYLDLYQFLRKRKCVGCIRVHMGVWSEMSIGKLSSHDKCVYLGTVLLNTGIHQNILEYTEIHRNTPEYAGIRRNTPEYVHILHDSRDILVTFI